MEVTKQWFEREECYYFYLQEDNKILSIIFGGNLDLYWNLNLRNKYDITEENRKKLMYDELKDTFTITKENYFIYSLFEDLYEDIKNSRIYELTIPKQNEEIDEEEKTLELEEDIWPVMSQEEIDKRNEEFKNIWCYNLLFDGEKIEWHSDDETYEIADKLEIRKVDDTFELTFTRPKMTKDKYFYLRAPMSISIRFRNSGSLYNPFNMIFMRMFNKLQEYDPECHQLHFEEMDYVKKRSLKKN